MEGEKSRQFCCDGASAGRCLLVLNQSPDADLTIFPEKWSSKDTTVSVSPFTNEGSDRSSEEAATVVTICLRAIPGQLLYR
ncbi:hypothetical protein CEXT_661001 [Caerostris extrusa]|uniref:Uncharacterized protein n=1 Tax=Caerostris extrusa TaxID=172846 RepID=A0AAV4Y4C6_CAEEX|nr:hypothetical protein CEXT_661001 [Caerostris extrusa]